MGLLTLRYYFDQQDMELAEKILFEQRLENFPEKTLLGKMAEDLKIEKSRLYCEKNIFSRYEGKVVIVCGEETKFNSLKNKEKYIWLVSINSKKALPYSALSKGLYTENP